MKKLFEHLVWPTHTHTHTHTHKHTHKHTMPNPVVRTKALSLRRSEDPATRSRSPKGQLSPSARSLGWDQRSRPLLARRAPQAPQRPGRGPGGAWPQRAGAALRAELHAALGQRPGALSGLGEWHGLAACGTGASRRGLAKGSRGFCFAVGPNTIEILFGWSGLVFGWERLLVTQLSSWRPAISRVGEEQPTSNKTWSCQFERWRSQSLKATTSMLLSACRAGRTDEFGVPRTMRWSLQPSRTMARPSASPAPAHARTAKWCSRRCGSVARRCTAQRTAEGDGREGAQHPC